MKLTPCEVLLLTLGYSNYTKIAAFLSQGTEHTDEALSGCFTQLGRVSKALVPDNFKCAIIPSNRYEPRINEYQRRITQVRAKLQSERHGLHVLERIRSSERPHHAIGRDLCELKMTKQTAHTEQELEKLNVKLHTAQSMYWYYIVEKKTRQAAEKSEAKVPGFSKKSKTPRTRSVQDTVR